MICFSAADACTTPTCKQREHSLLSTTCRGVRWGSSKPHLRDKLISGYPELAYPKKATPHRNFIHIREDTYDGHLMLMEEPHEALFRDNWKPKIYWERCEMFNYWSCVVAPASFIASPLEKTTRAAAGNCIHLLKKHNGTILVTKGISVRLILLIKHTQE